jgi:hypothetical protein
MWRIDKNTRFLWPGATLGTSPSHNPAEQFLITVKTGARGVRGITVVTSDDKGNR